MHKTDKEWQAILTPEQFKVCREKGTELPFSGKLLHNKEAGIYTCSCCGHALFNSEAKFDSSSGWPSFYQTKTPNSTIQQLDTSHNMVRTEVICAQCNAHLGHLFNDGPKPTGLRFCINSIALNFKPKESP